VKVKQTIGYSSIALLLVVSPTPLLAQSTTPAGTDSNGAEPPAVALTVAAGRSLEVVLEERVTIRAVGQSVTGVLVEPIYAYDRVVVPAGAKICGRVAGLADPPKLARMQTMLQGDFTPHRRVLLQFDTIVFDDGRSMAIDTLVRTEIPHLKRTDGPPSETESTDGPEANETREGNLVHRAEREATNRVKAAVSSGRDVLSEITQPGRGDRLKAALVEKLPYHHQFIDGGTGYEVELLSPLDFGRAVPSERAAAGALPAPSSILNARLLTTLDSAKTPRGTPIRAVVTQPVFSADRRLILPEGTTLDGEVTLATPARGFHRNGQLRFLFETVHLPAGDQAPLLASLQSVHTSGDDRMELDNEGGAKVTNSKTRFIEPTLALLALRGTLDQHEHLDPDGDGHVIHSSNPGAVTAGGFFGLGLLGIPLSHLATPISVTLSVMGAGRSVYRNVLAKGREAQFPADTVMRLRLAPGPTGAR
jgi:hypothetical protein